MALGYVSDIPIGTGTWCVVHGYPLTTANSTSDPNLRQTAKYNQIWYSINYYLENQFNQRMNLAIDKEKFLLK